MNKEIRTIFDQWTEISAYIFGFWLADGNIVLNKSHNKLYKCFCLFNTDLQIMEVFADILKTKIDTYTKLSSNHKICYKIRIYSDNMFDFCYNFTQSTNKSDKEIPFPEIPKEVFQHFVRGFFDGDGSIHVKHYKTRHGKIIEALQTSFTAGKDTGDFLQHLKEQLRLFISVGDKKITGKTNRHLAFNQYDSMLLCEWMYRDATIFMKRKKDIWDSIDKERLKKSTVYFSNKV